MFNKLVNALYAARIGCKLTLTNDEVYHIEVGLDVNQRIHDRAEQCALDLGIDKNKIVTCGEAHLPRVLRVQNVNGGPKDERPVPSHLRHLPKQIQKYYK